MKRVSEVMNGLQTSLAKNLNKLFKRSGRLWGDRFHVHVLETARQVRNVLVYVLQNGVKHDEVGIGTFDPCSSARAFNGWVWREPEPVRGIAEPRGRLLRGGWQRAGGWICPYELLPAMDRAAGYPLGR